MLVDISDDFDLEKIRNSGQCFRVRSFDDGLYRFITGCHVLYIKEVDTHRYWVSCAKHEWLEIWYDYLDLHRSYSDIANKEKGKHSFVDDAIAFGRGLRILKQDPWEMLITFIVSQRKSIPAISKAIEELSMKYGQEITTDVEKLYIFPTVKEMKKASYSELSACGFGYRTRYIVDAINQVNSN